MARSLHPLRHQHQLLQNLLNPAPLVTGNIQLGAPCTRRLSSSARVRAQISSSLCSRTTNLDNHYLRSLGYLISAKSKPDLPTVAVVLAEAARAAADYARERTIHQLNQQIHLDLLPSS